MDDSERSIGKDLKFRKSMVKLFYDCVFEDALASAIFKFHRELCIGKAAGLCEDEEDETALPSSSGEHYDIFGHEASTTKKAVECKCFVCHRMIAAARFVPHLEKCIGIGRNSRVTRRRQANYAENTRTTAQLRNSLASLQEYDVDETVNDEDEEWSNQSTKRRPRTRSSRKANAKNAS